MRVKICGITNIEDALFACEAGADALGFVFYEKSPRFMSVAQVKEIIDKLPPFITNVGLFVNESAEKVNEIMYDCGLNLAQIHFDASSEFYDKLSHPYIKVIRAKTKSDILKYKDNFKIIDAFVSGYGGEGVKLNLDWFKEADTSKIILAGGLNSENIKEVAEYGFYAVDVSSGVEKNKRKKDHKKIKNFIKLAKIYDKQYKIHS